MFNFTRNKDLTLIALIALGFFAQNNQINLANNTTILLLLFFLLMQDERITRLEELEAVEHGRGPSPRTEFARGCCQFEKFFR